MPRYSYGPMAIVQPDPAGGAADLVLQNATDGKMYQTQPDAEAQSNPLPIYDFNGGQLDEIKSGPFGQAQWLAEQAEPNGFVRFGDLIVAVDAREVAGLAQDAADAVAESRAARDAAETALAEIRQLLADGGGAVSIDSRTVQKVVRWNPGGNGAAAGWDKRNPDDLPGVRFISTYDPAAPPPADPDQKYGDGWAPNLRSPYLPGNTGGPPAITDGF
ncbi:hypothetical protein GCM10009616_35670 [Microlunatus lacustris]